MSPVIQSVDNVLQCIDFVLYLYIQSVDNVLQRIDNV